MKYNSADSKMETEQYDCEEFIRELMLLKERMFNKLPPELRQDIDKIIYNCFTYREGAGAARKNLKYN